TRSYGDWSSDVCSSDLARWARSEAGWISAVSGCPACRARLYPAPVQRLITELGKLPGIGQRTAQRLAFHILRSDLEDATGLADRSEERRVGKEWRGRGW